MDTTTLSHEEQLKTQLTAAKKLVKSMSGIFILFAFVTALFGALAGSLATYYFLR